MSFKFEELTVYQKAIDFVNAIYTLTKKFPNDETFALTSQLRRAAVSISLNIAEGSARSKKDFGRFIDMARGSVFECVTILKIALRQNYLSQSEFNNLENDLIELSKMLSGLKRKLTIN
jgi:four helix bundle protein